MLLSILNSLFQWGFRVFFNIINVLETRTWINHKFGLTKISKQIFCSIYLYLSLPTCLSIREERWEETDHTTKSFNRYPSTIIVDRDRNKREKTQRILKEVVIEERYGRKHYSEDTSKNEITDDTTTTVEEICWNEWMGKSNVVMLGVF